MPFETSYGETLQVKFGFFLLLWDAYSKSADLLGDVVAQTGAMVGLRRGQSGVFQFPPLPAGNQVFSVASRSSTPYYRPSTIPVQFPQSTALWPAFPDLGLADRDLRLEDPAQPAPYQTQRASAALLPTIAYPFDSSATLARGTVFSGPDPLDGATVSRVGGAEIPFVTGADGQFVLFFPSTAGMEEDVVLRTTHPSFPDKDAHVTLLRGMTVSVRFDM